VSNLCVGLSVGDEELYAKASRAEPDALLLRHLVAGATDQKYVESLQLSAFLGRVSHLPRPLAVGRALWNALFLNRAQVDKIYGQQRSRAGYLWRQVLRPLDLLVEATHSLANRFWTGLRRKT
jgi:hypothetical protein